ncbi:MAG: PAS domain S-box protein [Chthonomonadaceae bacterium]|nr:PAS domain S-box protein [Chthonomonadaceae bacterium]
MLGSPEVLSLIIETAQDYAFVLVDSARTIIGWNAGAERLLGWTENEITGEDAGVFFTPEDREDGVVDREFEKAQSTGRADDHRWHIRKDKTRFYASGWLYKVEGESFSGFVKVFRDLTEMRIAEERLRRRDERFRVLSENLQEFIYISGADGILTYINPQWTDYTGLTLSDTQKDSGVSVMHPDDSHNVMAAWQKAFRSGEPFEVQFRCRNKQGEYRWFLSRAFPVFNSEGTVEQWVGSSTDIEEQKRTQAEIESLNVRLNRAMQETHHRVKNNLQVISSLIEIQAGKDPTSLSSPAKQRIGQHIQSLAAIHDLLTQRSKNNEDATHVSIQIVLAHLLPLLQSTNPHRLFRTDIEEMILPVSRAAALSLLISECVSNAVKHGTGAIEVSLHSKEDGSKAVLEVCDDGDGFPPDFDPMSAANTGLSLIDNTARWDLRGEIAYMNRPEGGARVIVTFPILE